MKGIGEGSCTNGTLPCLRFFLENLYRDHLKAELSRQHEALERAAAQLWEEGLHFSWRFPPGVVTCLGLTGQALEL